MHLWRDRKCPFMIRPCSIWRLPMMTSSNGNIFRVTGPLCGEFTGPGEFHTQRPVTRSFAVFFDLRLNKRLSKQPWGWWFETLSWSLWRHRNAWTEPGVWGATLHKLSDSTIPVDNHRRLAAFFYQITFLPKLIFQFLGKSTWTCAMAWHWMSIKPLVMFIMA